MFAPNVATHMLADATHQERLSHAARIQLIKFERGAFGTPRDPEQHRRITARRLVAAGTGLLLSVAVAAAVGASRDTQVGAPSTTSHAPGGGMTLIR